MKLSIVIVNYNVAYFLEQCLNSVQKSIEGLDAEVWVVDNNSFDGSCAMVKEKFPWVKLIENHENTGFSKANNQAIRQSTGEYVLLLNPDTVVEEDTFRKTIAFMDAHTDAGGLGVYMIDGKGNFLPESKRGLPTPFVSFCKISGLSRLFPRSKKFNRYHLGYLDKNKTHEVEILSGAFMMMRKAALNKTGLLDETFFMYGEDIDLSYRILQAGYKNYYFPDTKIIHYKGESTRKTSVNYVLVFYNAMIIFARKHFSRKNARLFSFLIRVAIYLRAGMAIASRFFSGIWVPLADMAGSAASMWAIAYLYNEYTGIAWPVRIVTLAMGAYLVTWMISLWISGAYDKPLRFRNILKGFLFGTAIILIVYGLLPKTFQFSRSFILFSALASFLWFLLVRGILTVAHIKKYSLIRRGSKNIAIVGLPDEAGRVRQIIEQSSSDPSTFHLIAPAGNVAGTGYDANASQLTDFVYNYKISEVIFCARDNAVRDIMNQMDELRLLDCDFKIAQPDSSFIIGSNSVNASGEAYTLDIQSLNTSTKNRNKRLADLITSVLLLVTAPVNIWWVRKKGKYLVHLVRIISGRQTFIGLDQPAFRKSQGIFARPGVLLCTANYTANAVTPALREKMNFLYIRDYHPGSDIRLIFNHFYELGS